MGSKSRRKGRRGEREIIYLHKSLCIPARRRQETGIADSKEDPDILVAGALTAESKLKAPAQCRWRTLEKWLGDHDLLFVREDNKQPLVMMPWNVYAALITCWHEKGA